MSAVFPRRLLTSREISALPTISLPDVIAYLQRHPDTSFFYYATYADGNYIVKGYYDSAHSILRMRFAGSYSRTNYSTLTHTRYYAVTESYNPIFRHVVFRKTMAVFEPTGYTSAQAEGYTDYDYMRGISPLTLPAAAAAATVGVRASSFRYTWQRRRRRCFAVIPKTCRGVIP